LSLHAIKCCFVVFGVTMRLLVINISPSFPVINKLRRLLPAISVTTCGTVVRWRHVDNTWPVAALTADIGSESRFLPTHLHSTPPLRGSRRNIAMSYGTEKLEWFGYPTVKIFEDMFIRFDRIRTWQTHRHTPHYGIARACIALRAKTENCQIGVNVQAPRGHVPSAPYIRQRLAQRLPAGIVVGRLYL